jgi:hypothetical protein
MKGCSEKYGGRRKIILEFRKSQFLLCISLQCDLITILSIVEGILTHALKKYNVTIKFC